MQRTRLVVGRNTRTSSAHGRGHVSMPPPAPTLGALALTGATFAADALAGAAIGTLSGMTAGSTIAVFPAEPRVSLVGTGLRVGSTAASAGTFSVTIRETLTGASNTPRDSTFTITVSAAATPPPVVTLAALTLSASSFTAGDAEGTFIGAISGKTTGSTLSLSPSDTHIKIVGTNLLVGPTSSSAGTLDITIRETLTGATNTPKDTGFSLTIAEAPAAPVVSTYGNDGSGSIPGGATVVTPVTLAAAISGAATSANLVLALEPGSYGAVTITKDMDSGKTLTLYGQTGVSFSSLYLNSANGIAVKYANVSSVSGNFAIQVSGGSRLTLEHITGNPGGTYSGVGVSIRDSDTVSVTNCDFSFYGTAIAPASSTNVTISDNRITDIGDNFIFYNLCTDLAILRNLLMRPGGPSDGQHRDAIQGASAGTPDEGGPIRSARVQIENNTYIRDSGLSVVQGIGFIESTDDLSLRFNVDHGSASNGMSISDCNRVTVEGNQVQGRTDADGQGNAGSGSQILARGNSDTITFLNNKSGAIGYLTNAEICTNVTPVGAPLASGAPANTVIGFNGNTFLADATGIADTAALLTFLAANPDNPRP